MTITRLPKPSPPPTRRAHCQSTTYSGPVMRWTAHLEDDLIRLTGIIKGVRPDIIVVFAGHDWLRHLSFNQAYDHAHLLRTLYFHQMRALAQEYGWQDDLDPVGAERDIDAQCKAVADLFTRLAPKRLECWQARADHLDHTPRKIFLLEGPYALNFPVTPPETVCSKTFEGNHPYEPQQQREPQPFQRVL